MTADGDLDLRAEVTRLRAELGRERRARVHRLAVHQLAADTAGQITRRGVAEVIAEGLAEIFGSHWAMVAFVGDDEIIQFVHGGGVPDDVAADWRVAPLDTAIPIADVLRGSLERCALTSADEFEPWPILAAEAERAEVGSLFVEPIGDDGRPDAVVCLGWRTDHEMDAASSELLADMIDAASPAFARAITTEVHRDVASTLQNWLLPAELPEIDAFEIATLYEPGKVAMDVGGDWYDVIRLDDSRALIVIGDVVGHDARAAAEMGQVRHVLASHLIASGEPATSLGLADDYFHRRVANTMATALVMLFDTQQQTLEIASAGHLPPVMAGGGRAAAVVECGLGPPLGSGLGGYSSQVHEFVPGGVLVAYTDGVVELRDESIDDSVAQLCSELDAAGSEARLSVEAIIDIMATRSREPWRTDDAAAVVVRAR